MRSLRLTVTLIFLFSGSFVVFSAPGPPVSTTGPSCWPPPCVPIDGGISFLIAAGAAYGAKKIYDHRRKQPGKYS